MSWINTSAVITSSIRPWLGISIKQSYPTCTLPTRSVKCICKDPSAVTINTIEHIIHNHMRSRATNNFDFIFFSSESTIQRMIFWEHSIQLAYLTATVLLSSYWVMPVLFQINIKVHISWHVTLSLDHVHVWINSAVFRIVNGRESVCIRVLKGRIIFENMSLYNWYLFI